MADGEVVAASGPFATINRWFEKIGFETRGVERVKEEDRDHHVSDAFLLTAAGSLDGKAHSGLFRERS